ncbi:MAG TPA: carboxypeptidase-like regulatory domain-containing protein [Dinghuibacter sp.]|uniref:carboxypeptidase-like regulatory domain-containing protein n=1 Tax=Dinghuibacter sp. TaxID=2024697 RepID=UPI002CA83DB5|nr:carboxypeptidase-like regulatory domain-containing protein [Dinghuibacter sp.]HTJ14322.1 carboxypeptidase-like regulatory domain-containing protein [Dinghuibacter sp.]
MKSWTLLTALLLITSAASAQRQIRGRVTAADNGKPLAGASVFISNTSRGTVTDEKGMFVLDNVPDGRYVLVISSVGYQTDLETIDSRYPQADYAITLRTKIAELGEVTVRAFDKDGYKRWGELFRENFIGTSDFARNCKILNPEVIKIHYAPKSRTLSAYSDGPILVQNAALGYEVQVTLDDFHYYLANGETRFSFFPLFREMPGSPSKKARWARNRNQAYFGSTLHFFRALYQDRVREEGFVMHTEAGADSAEVQRIKNNLRRALIQAREAAGPDGQHMSPEALLGANVLATFDNALDNARSSMGKPYLYNGETPLSQVVVARDSNVMVLEFDDYLRVTYLRNKAPSRYFNDVIIDPNHPESGRKIAVTRSGLEGMTTHLELIRGLPMEVFANGSNINTDLSFDGYWNWWERIGNMLPYDYVPEPLPTP